MREGQQGGSDGRKMGAEMINNANQMFNSHESINKNCYGAGT